MTSRLLPVLLAALACPAFAATAPHSAAPMLADPDTLLQAERTAAGQTLADFRKAYQRAGQPRLAIYFNRELSDDVEEWKTPVRIEQAVTNRKGELMQAETAVHLRAATTGHRTDPAEDRRWAFEDGFHSTFLAERAKLVDRRLMLRLAAAKRPEDAKATVAIRHVEVDAFKGYADVLVEVLIQRNASAPSGYNFKAQATSVKNAQILALVNASDIEPAQGRYVAGPNGYERASSSDPEYIKSVGQQLAQRLMAALATGL